MVVDQDGAEEIMTEAIDEQFLQAAIAEARKGLAEGGVPIGSVLVIVDQVAHEQDGTRPDEKEHDAKNQAPQQHGFCRL